MNGDVEDVNKGAESSTTPTAATGASATPTATTADSPPQGDKKPDSIAAALEKVTLEMPEETGNEATPESTTEEAPPSEKTETGEPDPKPDAAKDEPAKGKEGAQASDVPFHNRPEWKTAMTALNELPDKGAKLKPIIREAFERETRANQALTAVKPLADITTELKTIVGGDKEFDAMRNVVRGFAAGDPAVLPILKQMVSNIEKIAGEVLSSPDLVGRQTQLQKQFTDGLIDQAEFDAQSGLLKETERARAGKSRVETQLKTTAQSQQTEAEQRTTAERVGALNSWETNIRQRDPDFGAVTDVNAPNHGESVADQVFDAISLKFMQNPGATNEDLIGAAQRAYDRARKGVAQPAARTSKVVTSASSSTTGRPRPKTLREAMDSVRLE